jgi:hypothetical protein
LLESCARIGDCASDKIGDLHGRGTRAHREVHFSRKIELRARCRLGLKNGSARIITGKLDSASQSEPCILDSDTRLLRSESNYLRHSSFLAAEAYGKKNVYAFLLAASTRRILLQHRAFRCGFADALLTLLRMEARFLERSGGIFVQLSHDIRKDSVVGNYFSAKGKEEDESVREQKPAHADDEIRDRTPGPGAQVQLSLPAKTCCKRAVDAMHMREDAQAPCIEN